MSEININIVVSPVCVKMEGIIVLFPRISGAVKMINLWGGEDIDWRKL